MRYCPNCEKEVLEEATQCPFCGCQLGISPEMLRRMEEEQRAAEEAARREAEAKARAEAEARAREQALRKQREEAERAAREAARKEAVAKARAEAEAKAEERAREQALRKQKEEAEKAAREAARKEAEAKARAEAEAKAKARAEAEAKAGSEEEANVQEEKTVYQPKPRVTDDKKKKSSLPLIICAGLAVLIVIIGVNFIPGDNNETNNNDYSTKHTEKATLSREEISREETRRNELRSRGYVDLGLPSGTFWKNSNEGDGIVSQDEAMFKYYYQLPTKADFEELAAYCTITWYGPGCHVVGPNGASIYLPAQGEKFFYDSINDCETYILTYWTSTPTVHSDYSGGYYCWFWNEELDGYTGIAENPEGGWHSVRLVEKLYR